MVTQVYNPRFESLSQNELFVSLSTYHVNKKYGKEHWTKPIDCNYDDFVLSQV